MNNSHGSILFAFILVVLLTALSAIFLLRGANEAKVAKRYASSTAALWAAEAGLNKVLWEYNYNNCTGMVQEGTATACTSCTSCGVGNKTIAGTLAGYGDYDVTLNSANTILQSTGSILSRTDPNKIQRRVQTAIGRPAIFGHGLYAQGQITLSNNALVDSYNSTNGAYGGSNIASNGDVGTNGTSAGIIQIDNNADVKGDVSTGVGGTVSLGNGATISGTTTSTNSIALPAVVVPTSLTSLGSGGTLSLGNNGSQTLSAGDYKYTDIALGNNATLNISGNVRLYLSGKLVSGTVTSLDTGTAHVNINVASGGSVTVYTDGVVNLANNITINVASQLPSKFLIYSTYAGANGVTVNNNGTTYAAVYAPQTDVNISNNAGFFGSVVGKTTTLDNNGEVHYDEALASLANPFENAIVSNWQEI